MLAFAGGDLAAFDALYARHRRGLHAFLSRLLAGQEVAVDDVFQEAWLAVTRARTGYQPSAPFRAWLYQLARHRTIDLLRVRRPRLASELLARDGAGDPFDELPAPESGGPEALLERHQQGAALERALQALPAVQREAFLLHEHGGLSLQEVATLSGVGLETARSRFRYAIARLRAALRGTWP